jgi:hypothetical protein
MVTIGRHFSGSSWVIWGRVYVLPLESNKDADQLAVSLVGKSSRCRAVDTFVRYSVRD